MSTAYAFDNVATASTQNPCYIGMTIGKNDKTK